MSNSRFQFKMNIFLLNKETMDEEYRLLKSLSSYAFFSNRELRQISIRIDLMTYHVSTSLGNVCLAWWVQPIKTEQDILLSITPKGAIKYLFMCYDLDSLNLLKKILKFNIKHFNMNTEFIILLSKNACQELTKKQEKNLTYLFDLFDIKKYSVEFWESSADIESIFKKIIRGILSSFISIDYDLEVRSIFDTYDLVTLTQKLGFKPKDNQIVEIFDDLLFTVNLKSGTVTVEPTFCQDCELTCPVHKSLCIVVDERGYSNLPLLYHNLRILSILCAIRDSTIMELKGEKSQKEDVRYQIGKIVKDCEDCRKRRIQI